MRARCPRCALLMAQCVCALVAPIDNRTPVRVLQDPRESKHALNTARWVALGLRHAKVVSRATFAPEDWTIPGRQSLLLYPAEADDPAAADADATAAALRAPDDAAYLAPPSASKDASTPNYDAPIDAAQPASVPLTLVVLDGTWKHAAGILRNHPALLALPRFGLAPAAVSAYRLRKSPRMDGLATVEAVAAALDLIDTPQNHATMLRPFRAHVDAQIRAQLVAMGETAFRRNYPHVDIENMA
ncbi:tRNA-uridine aminocarboxypropyltransferase [Alcaligenaceae bacterium C4P045]|nr:tRNA-uridine aminocarboxypropyltransferase [Alcaligenaceae bacterium C4P045]